MLYATISCGALIYVVNFQGGEQRSSSDTQFQRSGYASADDISPLGNFLLSLARVLPRTAALLLLGVCLWVEVAASGSRARMSSLRIAMLGQFTQQEGV